MASLASLSMNCMLLCFLPLHHSIPFSHSAPIQPHDHLPPSSSSSIGSFRSLHVTLLFLSLLSLLLQQLFPPLFLFPARPPLFTYLSLCLSSNYSLPSTFLFLYSLSPYVHYSAFPVEEPLPLPLPSFGCTTCAFGSAIRYPSYFCVFAFSLVNSLCITRVRGKVIPSPLSI